MWSNVSNRRKKKKKKKRKRTRKRRRRRRRIGNVDRSPLVDRRSRPFFFLRFGLSSLFRRRRRRKKKKNRKKGEKKSGKIEKAKEEKDQPIDIGV